MGSRVSGFPCFPNKEISVKSPKEDPCLRPQMKKPSNGGAGLGMQMQKSISGQRGMVFDFNTFQRGIALAVH